eukprot:TRINITY_DN146_c0_g1_i2.p1 TRINITY_DN146_c0_g1~~TRINITY_DN146_c0_g1_i2.p1  ORF type:complete len:226 (+),score=31.66 TRINITY_DN146_c0_g1_i2:268-945(+)
MRALADQMKTFVPFHYPGGKEVRIGEILREICVPDSFRVYDYSPPDMIEACRSFKSQFEDDIEEALMGKDVQDKHLRSTLCGKKEVCPNGLWELTNPAVARGEPSGSDSSQSTPPKPEPEVSKKTKKSKKSKKLKNQKAPESSDGEHERKNDIDLQEINPNDLAKSKKSESKPKDREEHNRAPPDVPVEVQSLPRTKNHMAAKVSPEMAPNLAKNKKDKSPSREL